MAQVPATPKLKRLVIRTLAAVLGPKVTANLVAIQPSEAAALTLSLAPKPSKAAKHVCFILPLVGATDVDDWEAVQKRLAATLASFQAQTNPNWSAYVACQDSIDLPVDPRIHHLPFDKIKAGNDKWDKLYHLAQHLPTQGLPAGYVMSFDADDILALDAVETMLSGPFKSGHLVELGYVKDMQNLDVALAQNAFRCRPFWKLCGSCAAFRYDEYTATFATAMSEILQHEHRMFPYLAQLAGRPLIPFTSPMVLYLLNHGENFGARRGRVGFKSRFVQRFKITKSTQLDDLNRRFVSHE